MFKLAHKTVPVVCACGHTAHHNRSSIEALIGAGRVALLVRAGRKPDGAVVRVLLLAMAGEIARRSPQSTIQRVLPTTWTHRASLRAGY